MPCKAVLAWEKYQNDNKEKDFIMFGTDGTNFFFMCVYCEWTEELRKNVPRYDVVVWMKQRKTFYSSKKLNGKGETILKFENWS